MPNFRVEVAPVRFEARAIKDGRLECVATGRTSDEAIAKLRAKLKAAGKLTRPD